MAKAGSSTKRHHRRRTLWLALVLVVVLAPLLVLFLIGWQLGRPLTRAGLSADRVAPPAIELELATTAAGDPYLIANRSEGESAEKGRRLLESLQQMGWQGLPTAPGELGVLVLLHGRDGSKDQVLGLLERFAALGFTCLVPDLPGHGEHPRSACSFGLNEADLPSRVLLDWAGRHAVTEPRAALWGMSMGGSVAVHAAALNPELWSALVVVSSFDDLSSLVRERVHMFTRDTSLTNLFYPCVALGFRLASGMGLERVRPAVRMREHDLPTFVIHGAKDSLIEWQRGLRLHDHVVHADRQWYLVSEGGHHNVLLTADPLYAMMSDWFLLFHSRETNPSVHKTQQQAP